MKPEGLFKNILKHDAILIYLNWGGMIFIINTLISLGFTNSTPDGALIYKMEI